MRLISVCWLHCVVNDIKLVYKDDDGDDDDDKNDDKNDNTGAHTYTTSL